jgi:hypothetical protein
VTLRWPVQATGWLSDLHIQSGEPVNNVTHELVKRGRAAMQDQLGQKLACLAVTPFQPGVGQGRGYQRSLSAPNLVQHLADTLLGGAGLPAVGHDQHALVVLFLSTRYEHLADGLAGLNALLPLPELVRTEKRARHLSELEAQKWIKARAGSLPRWGSLSLERCPFIKATQKALSGHLSTLESMTTNRSPLQDLRAIADRKAERRKALDRQLSEIKEHLAKPDQGYTMVARLLKPSTAEHWRRQLLDEAAPGHEWVLCAGMMLVGPQEGLRFVQELVGL